VIESKTEHLGVAEGELGEALATVAGYRHKSDACLSHPKIKPYEVEITQLVRSLAKLRRITAWGAA